MELKVFERTQKLSQLRKDGFMPAVVYDKVSNRSVFVERKAFDRVFRQVSTHGVITLAFEGGTRVDTMVKAVSMDKRKRVPEHADFYIVTDEPVEVSVPVHTTGNPRGVREGGGVLDVVLHTVTVKAPPKILIDVTNVGINEPVHLRDITLPDGVLLVNDPDLTVVTVHPPRQAEAEPETAAAEPEVIAKGKDEDED